MSTAAFVVSALLTLWAVRAVWYWRMPHRSRLGQFVGRRWTMDQKMMHWRAVGMAYGRTVRSLAFFATMFAVIGWLLR